MTTTISVIIPTYNGEARIANILSALNAQSFKEFEVIVAIDGSDDQTEEIAKSFNPRFKAIKVAKQENKGRASIRNFGARHAHGDLLLFFDDDIRPSEDCVKEHLSHHSTASNSIMVGAIYEDEALMETDFQKFKAYLSRKWQEPLKHNNKPLTADNLFLTAANFSISKKTFFDLGGFDERLTDGEDHELGARALRNNIPVYYNQAAIGWHDDFITCRNYILRKREYYKSNQRIKNLGLPHRLFLVKTPVWKRMAFSLAGQPFLVDLIERGKLAWLPLFLRYRLYDWVVTSLGSVYVNRML